MTIMETEQATTVLPEIDTTEGTWGMDPSLKQRWVTALRSGKYVQGKGRFELDGEFCVLGVLCDVAGQPPRVGPGVDNYDFVDATIPGKPSELWVKNDFGGWSFNALADFIEANY